MFQLRMLYPEYPMLASRMNISPHPVDLRLAVRRFQPAQRKKFGNDMP